MNKTRIRKSAALVATGAALTIGQLAFAGGAFAADSACPITWQHTDTFRYSPSTFVVDGGLDFGLTSSTQLAGVTLTVSATNIQFGKATATGGTVTSSSSSGATATATVVASGGKFSLHFPATLTKNAHSQNVTVTAKGAQLNCQPLSLTTNYDTTKPKPTAKPTTSAKPTTKPTTAPSKSAAPAPTHSAAPAPTGNGGGGGKDLAETGANSNTPMLIGGAGALVVLGGGLAFFAKKRRTN